MPKKPNFHFSEGDLVRIKSQPENNAHVDLVGLTCLIEEIGRHGALVNALSLAGSITGSGTVPTRDLVLVQDEPEWTEAKRKYAAHFARIEEEAEKRAAAWANRVARVAKRFGLTPRKVQDIFDLLNDPNQTGR